MCPIFSFRSLCQLKRINSHQNHMNIIRNKFLQSKPQYFIDCWHTNVTHYLKTFTGGKNFHFYSSAFSKRKQKGNVNVLTQKSERSYWPSYLSLIFMFVFVLIFTFILFVSTSVSFFQLLPFQHRPRSLRIDLQCHVEINLLLQIHVFSPSPFNQRK